MFRGASAFNQDISDWNTSSVNNMNSMFDGASAFNQDLRSYWNVCNVKSFNNFNDSTLDPSYVPIFGNTVKCNFPVYLKLTNNQNDRNNQLQAISNVLQNDIFVNAECDGMCYPRINYSNEDLKKIVSKFVLLLKKISEYNSDFTGSITFEDQSTYTKQEFINKYGPVKRWRFGPVSFEKLFENKKDWDDNGGKYISNLDDIKNNVSNIYEDISEWDTSQVTNMRGMFSSEGYDSGSYFYNQDLSKWDTGNVTDMSSMCKNTGYNSFFNSNISKWNTGKVKDMSSMFDNAIWIWDPDLEGTDLSKWDTSNVTDMSSMFKTNTPHGKFIFNQDLSDWDVSNVTDMTDMFDGATEFNQDLSDWDVSNVTSMSSMFYDTKMNHDLSDWDVDNVTKPNDPSGNLWMGGKFSSEFKPKRMSRKTKIKNIQTNAISNVLQNGIISTITINIRNSIRTDADIQTAVDAWKLNSLAAETTYGHIREWDTSKVTDMSRLFSNSYNNRLVDTFNDDISNWDTSNVTNMEYMFLYNVRAFNQDIGKWNVSNVTNMKGMFFNATSFNKPLNNWDTSKVTNMSYMFYNYAGPDGRLGISAFNQPLNNWDTSNVTDMEYMFFKAESFNGDISNWDTSNVTDMSSMFWQALAFNQDISNWDTSNVTDMRGMFLKAEKFNRPLNKREVTVGTKIYDVWDTSNVTNMSYMFSHTLEFNQPLNNWDTSSVKNMSDMFRDATSFNQPLNNWNVCNVTSHLYFNTGATALDLSYIPKFGDQATCNAGNPSSEIFTILYPEEYNEDNKEHNKKHKVQITFFK